MGTIGLIGKTAAGWKRFVFLGIAGVLAMVWSTARGADPLSRVWQNSELVDWVANLAVDARGNNLLLGSKGENIVVAQRNSEGILQWRKTFSSPTLANPQALVAAPGGESWILGWKANPTNFAPETREFLKLSATGDRILVVYPPSLVSTPFLASSTVLDAAGNLYIAGVHREPQADGGAERIVVVKLAPDGSELLRAQHPIPVGRQTTLHSVQLGPEGSFTLLASSVGAGGLSRWTIGRWGGDGALVWVTELAWETTGAFAKGMQVDSQGTVYLCGGGFMSGTSVMHLAKYSPDGALQWKWTEQNPRAHVFATDLKALSSGEFLILAQEEAFGGSQEEKFSWLLKRYTPAGVELWHSRHLGSTYGDAKMTQDNRLVVSSTRTLPDGARQDGLVVFDLQGQRVADWESKSLVVNRVAVDSDGDFVLEGMSRAGLSTLQGVRLGPTDDLARVRIEPGRQEVRLGERAMFQALPTLAGDFQYQWMHFGVPIPGATNNPLVLELNRPELRGDYSVTVSNALGRTTSTEAWLEVRVPPLIHGISTTNRLPEGRSYRLERRPITGDSPLNYQWQFAGVDIPGETNAVFGIQSVEASHAGEYRLTVTNPHGTAVSDPYRLDVVPRSPLDEWTWRVPVPQGNDLLSIAHGNGRYVAVGTAGTVLASTNGLDWNNHHAEFNGNLVEVQFADGRFVAVGSPGRILGSIDGAQWTAAKVPITENMVGVAHGNGIWLVPSRQRLYLSTNGVIWKESPWRPAVEMLGITFGAGRFVMLMADQNNPVFTSTDGSEWVPVAFNGYSPGSNSRKRIDFGGGRFVLVASEISWVSTNGLEWIASDPLAGRMLEDVAIGDSSSVAVGTYGGGADSERTRIFESADGLSWKTNSISLENNVHRVAWVGGRFFALGDDGQFITSRDGKDWVVISAAGDLDWSSIVEGGGVLLTVGQRGTAMRSMDGEVWESVATGLSLDLLKVVHGGDRFVAAGWNSEVWVTRDGTQWKGSRLDGIDLRSVAYGAGTFLATGYGKVVYSSTNGETWNPIPILDHLPPLSVTFGNGLWVGSAEPGFVQVSSDGRNWERINTGGTQPVDTIVFGNGRFLFVTPLAVDSNSLRGFEVWVSEDGRAWRREVWLPASNPPRIWFGAGRFFLQRANGFVLDSTDGREWTEHFIPFGAGVNDLVASSRGTLIAVGKNRAILETGNWVPWLRATRDASGLLGLELRGWPGKRHRLQSTDSLDRPVWGDVMEILMQGSRTNLDAGFPGNDQYYRLTIP